MSGRRTFRTLACAALLAGTLAVPCATASAVAYPSYNYDVWGQSVPVPATYRVESVVTGEGLGIGAFVHPGDVVAAGGRFYVLDAGNDRIVRLSGDLTRSLGVVVPRADDGTPVDISDAAGLHVTDDGSMRICLPEQGLVLALASDGTVLDRFGAPTGPSVPANLRFKPIRITVGPDGTQYVVCSGVFQGIVELDADGAFLGFFGSNRVDVTLQVLTELFWRRLFSQEQKENMLNIVPIEYSSLDAGPSGLIHAVTAESRNSMYEIKKLDPKGNNVLRVRPASSVPAGVVLNTGNYGDIESTYDQGVKVDTRLIDVAVDAQGFIFALDAQRGRIFEYDQESNLIAVFSGLGQQLGTTTAPVAIACLDDRVAVLDKAVGELTVFRPTDYGATIREATVRFNQGLYEEAESLWRSVLRRSVNCDLAYVGIGKALYSREDYAGAMRFFRLGYDKASYDEAWTEYRKDWLRSHFPLAVGVVLAALLLAFAAVRGARALRVGERLFRSTRRLPVKHAMFHPFKAFDDVRTEDKGTVAQAVLAVGAFFATRILGLAANGFLFNDTRPIDIRVGREFLVVAAVFSVFVVANWAASTWTEGEGRWRDILVVTGFALIPMTVGNLSVTVLSQVLTLREGAMMSLVSLVATYWSGFLLVTGLMTVHRHTFGRTALSLGLTSAGMLFVLFLASLVYSLFQQLVVFVGNIFTEILYRI